MRKNIQIILVALIAAIPWLLSGCGGSQVKMEDLAKTLNPAEEVNRFDSDIANARKDQLNVLAPTSFARAEEYLNGAKEALQGGDELSEITEKISSGRFQLERAQEMAQVARTTLPDAIKARELARAAGATSLGGDYVEAEDQFLKLTGAIENNDLNYAQNNRHKVATIFDELEVRAIKEQKLSEARKLIKEAEGEGARKIAPRTLLTAQQELKNADAFISQHRYEREKIQEKSSEALFQAQRVLQVTEQSKKVRDMEPEQITLWVEGMLEKMASQLSAPDMRNKTFQTQVENILGSIEAVQEDRKFMSSQEKARLAEIEAMRKEIALLEGKTKEEEAAKNRLEAEKRFNELFSEVKGYFDTDEAEVYKQGNRLIIRLREIQFPVGQSVIMPSNYALLSKVQRAIKSFGEPDVVIEGHTDSTGSDEVNEHLSQQRAESVRQYFVANGTLPEWQISSVGYGSSRPLASNETAEGRAINRRIDVAISPTEQGK